MLKVSAYKCVPTQDEAKEMGIVFKRVARKTKKDWLGYIAAVIGGLTYTLSLFGDIPMGGTLYLLGFLTSG